MSWTAPRLRAIRKSRMGAVLALVLIALTTACEIRPAPEPGLSLAPKKFGDLPAWIADRHAEALNAFLRSCPALLTGRSPMPNGVPVKATDWKEPCEAAKSVRVNDDDAARQLFETWFRPWLVRDGGNDEGLFTGYFEAELRGALTASGPYRVPLYGLPTDLVAADLGKFDPKLAGRSVVGRAMDGKLIPYFRRGEIEAGRLGGAAPVLAWVDDPLDAFLLQVQGSGRVLLPNGDVHRIGFAGHNGHPYRSIGRVLIERGDLREGQAGWPQIRDWLERNPDKAPALFAENPRFVFFRRIEGEGSIGAQGVPLTPRRSLAVDRKFIPLGAPVWLDTVTPGGDPKPLRRLMVAQDTGGAIKGVVRGDFFWGYGKDALAEAGRMSSRGRYFLLLPKPAGQRISQR